jgi:hypothetical protein
MWEDLLLFIAVGLAAQMVDGAIGMAYGVISTSVLLSVGVPPATASAAVHTAETFTTGASGLAHWRLGNIDRDLIWRLAVPGMIGGAIGAYVLTAIPGEAIRPYVSGYLFLLGLFILWKAVSARPLAAPPPSRVAPLGFAGGMLDAIGGGGWGPIVASTLIATGDEPRRSIGSVNLAEFFVTVAISVTFLTQLDLASYGRIVLGLVIGGAIAAPLAGWLIRVLPQRAALVLVGVVVGSLSVMNIVNLFR